MKIKKCAFCGNWTGVTGDANDECEVCQSPVNIESLRRQIKREEVSEHQPALFYHVQPTDHFMVKVLRRIAGGIYFVVMAIVSFIVWLVALLPG